MDPKRIETLRAQWLAEERIAHVRGWDFSHISDRYHEEDLPWDYRSVVDSCRRDDMQLLDFDTGGGEFLLSLHHPYANTAATEGYAPNVELCRQTLLPLGIRFKPCSDAAALPFADASFDLFLNRHGDLDPGETWRVLKPGGLFVTQQVASGNDRDLVERVLPGTPEPFPAARLDVQRRLFEAAGFEILRAEEASPPIVFTDVGAFVWFARIIEWEFPGFSVDNCFDQLLRLQEELDAAGRFAGTTRRYLLVARRPGGTEA